MAPERAQLCAMLAKYHVFNMELIGSITMAADGTQRYIIEGSGRYAVTRDINDLAFAPGRVMDRSSTTGMPLKVSTRPVGGRPLKWHEQRPEVQLLDVGACFSTGNPIVLHRLLSMLGHQLRKRPWRPGVPLARQIHDACWVGADPTFTPRHVGSLFGAMHDAATAQTALVLPKLSHGERSDNQEHYLMRDCFLASSLTFATGRINPSSLGTTLQAEIQARRPPANAANPHLVAAGSLVRTPEGNLRNWPAGERHDTHAVLSENNTAIAAEILQTINTALDVLELDLVLLHALAARAVKLHAIGITPVDPDEHLPAATATWVCVPTGTAGQPVATATQPTVAPPDHRWVLASNMRISTEAGGRGLPLHTRLASSWMPRSMPNLTVRHDLASSWLRWFEAMQRCQAVWMGRQMELPPASVEAQARLLHGCAQAHNRHILCGFEETRCAEVTIRAGWQLAEHFQLHEDELLCAVNLLDQWAQHKAPSYNQYVELEVGDNWQLCAWARGTERTSTNPRSAPPYVAHTADMRYVPVLADRRARRN